MTSRPSLGWFALPLALQAIAMFIDEAYFHRRRGLPRWERIGHPLDTATVLLCFAVALTQPPTPRWLAGYVALAAFSCFFVTKDEPVHAIRCSPGEHWLHAVLFVLHPVVLAGVGLLWVLRERTFILAQSAVTLAFGAYQLLYWNLIWRRTWTGRTRTR